MSLLDLVCPTRCASCGRTGRQVCAGCALVLAAPAVRHYPTPCPAALPPTWVVASYDGPTRALLLAFKEQGQIGLAAALGDALARAAVELIEPGMPTVLVPVPSAPSSIRRRGDDTVQLLASRAARVLRARHRRVCVVGALTQTRRVADSAGLSSAARAVNLAGALRVRSAAAHRLRGSAVVVVDDLVTTGTTLTEAAAALAAAGAAVVGAAAVAATRRRSNW
jgi:predicted amidophosphoribosyltransferase